MADTYTTSNRFEKMEPGQYLDTWGARWNAQGGSDLIDAALDGVESFALSGSKTLTNNNGAADEARKRILNVTGGTGGTITIPNVAKAYLVRNGSSDVVTITTGSGTTATIASGVTKWVFSTGSNVVYADSGPDFGAANIVTTGTATFGATSATTLATSGLATLASASVTATATVGGLALNGTGQIVHTHTGAGTIGSELSASHATYTGSIARLNTTRTGNAAFNFLVCTSNAFTDFEFIVGGAGGIASDGGTAMSTPADYADMMEWADGNPAGEDRIGYSVVLDGEKVRIATADDDPEDVIGIGSGNPSVCGGAGWNRWGGKFETDDFNRTMTEDYEAVEWTELPEPTEEDPDPRPAIHSFAVESIPDGVQPPPSAIYSIQRRRKLSANFDPTAPYIPRAERAEWDPIGLVGRIPMRKGCPVNPRWRKMRDISATAEEWLVR